MLINEYKGYLSCDRFASKHTINAYVSDAQSFISFLGKDLKELTSKDLVAFMQEKVTKGYAQSSMARYGFSIKQFIKFLMEEKIIQGNPLEHFVPIKKKDKLVEVITKKQVETILNGIDRSKKYGLRDFAMIELLYASGIRISELCNLNVLDASKGELRIMGKGGKERIVPIAERSMQAIDNHLSCERPTEANNPPLFVSATGRRMNRFTGWKIIHKRMLNAGIPIKKKSPHTLRHSYATELVENNAEIRVVQELLGHASIATTEKYTHISKKLLKEQFKKTHPRFEASSSE